MGEFLEPAAANGAHKAATAGRGLSACVAPDDPTLAPNPRDASSGLPERRSFRVPTGECASARGSTRTMQRVNQAGPHPNKSRGTGPTSDNRCYVRFGRGFRPGISIIVPLPDDPPRFTILNAI